MGSCLRAIKDVFTMTEYLKEEKEKKEKKVSGMSQQTGTFLILFWVMVLQKKKKRILGLFPSISRF